MRRTMPAAGLAGLSVRLTVIIVAAAALGGAGAAAAAAAGTAGTRAAAACAKVSVTAKPKLNTQAGSTETLRTTVTSCASKFEVIKLAQRMPIRGKFDGTIGLHSHERVKITQHIPYFCCDTITVTDRAFSTSGRLLGKAKATWTFA